MKGALSALFQAKPRSLALAHPMLEQRASCLRRDIKMRGDIADGRFLPRRQIVSNVDEHWGLAPASLRASALVWGADPLLDRRFPLDQPPQHAPVEDEPGLAGTFFDRGPT